MNVQKKILNLLVVWSLIFPFGQPINTRNFGAEKWHPIPSRSAKSATPDHILRQQETEYIVRYETPNATLLPLEAKEAIKKAVNKWPFTPPDNNSFFLISLRWEKNWALGTLTSANLDNPLEAEAETHLNFENLFTLLLVKTERGWQAALDTDDEVHRLLAYVSEFELSQNARTVLFPAKTQNQKYNVLEQQYNSYRLPWPAGSRWRVTNSWHDSVTWGGRFPPNYSLDFDIVTITNSDILSSAPGTVTYMCEGNNDQYLLVITTDGTTEKLGYLHLDGATVRNEGIVHGSQVTQGKKLGRMREGYISDNCGTSRGTHLHMYFPEKPFTVDGITFSQANVHFNEDLYSTQGQGSNDSVPPDGDYSNRSSLAGISFTGSVSLNAQARDVGSNASGIDEVLFRAYYSGGWHTIYRDETNCSGNNTCNYSYTWDFNQNPPDTPPDGPITLGFDIKDQSGNWAYTPRGTFTINKFTDDPPTISFNNANTTSISSNGQKIYSNNPNWGFSGMANDNNSVTQVKYEAWGNNGNQTAQASGTGNWSYSRNGLSGHNRIQFFAYDTIGQRNRDSDKHYIDLYIDTANPETNAGLSDSQGQNGWHISAVNVSLQATDHGSGNGGTTQNIPNHYSAGIDYVRYQIDGGAWQTYNGIFSVSGDGTHTVNYYAVDKVGNQENQKSITFKIDATPPTAPSGAVEQNGVTSDQWQTAINDPAFTWNAASDSTSGVARYQLYWGDQSNGQGATSVTGTSYDPSAVPTGTYYLRGRTQDHAGNWSSWVTLFTFRYDGTPPHNPEVVNQDGIISGLWQNTVRTADFSWSTPFDAGSGVDGYYIYWGTDENGTSTNFITANQFVSTTPICAANDACTYYLRLQTRDKVGLKADWVTAFALRYDNTAPVGSLIANHGLDTTNQTVIRLDIVASDTGSGVQKMRFSNEGTEWTDWEPFTTPVYWQIPNVGRRDYDILLQLSDAVPNVSDIISDTVFLDINPAQPTSDNYRLWNDSMNSGGEHSNSSSYTLRSSVGQNMDSRTSTSASYQITSGYQAGALAAPTIVPTYTHYSQTNYVMAGGGTPGSGLISANYQMRGTVGQPAHTIISTSSNYTLSSGYWAGVGLTSPPSEPPPPPPPPTASGCSETYQILINNDDSYTNQSQVALTLCGPDATEVRLSNEPTFSTATWEAYQETINWTLDITGTSVQPRFVYAQYRDSSGQVFDTLFDEIIYDPNAPLGTINAGESNVTMSVTRRTAGKTERFQHVQAFNNASVNLELDVVDDSSGLWEMQISEDPAFSDAAWEEHNAFYQWAASPEDGLKTIYARFRDRATNESVTASDTVLVDTTPPTATISVTNPFIGPGTISVTLNIEAIDNLSGVDEMHVSYSPVFSDTTWIPYDTTASLPISDDGNLLPTIYVQFRDQLGNESIVYEVPYSIDISPPIGVADVELGSGTQHTITLSAWDYESGVTEMWLSPDYFFRENVTIMPYTEVLNWDFGDAPVLYIMFVDGVGNFSERVSAVIPEVCAPLDTPTVSVAQSNNNLTLSWGLVTGAESYNIYRDNSAPYFTPTVPYDSTTNLAWTDVGAGNAPGNYYYVVQAVSSCTSSNDSQRLGMFKFSVVAGN